MSRRLRSVTVSQLDYSDPAGFQGLREAIAHHVQAARGTRCTGDQVVVVAGAQRGLEHICNFVLDPGDKAWLEEPGLLRGAQRVGRRGRADRPGTG